jgi:hypothetical protein
LTGIAPQVNYKLKMTPGKLKKPDDLKNVAAPTY